MKSSGQSTKFPAPIYRDTVLAPVFADAKRYFLEPLLEIEYAHTLMLARQGIMPDQEAASCIRALDALDREEIRSAEYDGSFEDLFFYLEKKFAAACGEEVAGKMHTARSRNDIDLTMYRMVLRQHLLHLFEGLLELRSTLVELAWEHRAALMPAYTHNQPAQPTTLGHYLMAYIEILERDAERIRNAYVRVNRNPLGACAITTTGFPINRNFTEKLLGFEGLQVNSYGAIAATDYVVESCGILATAMLSLGRFVQDLLLWSTAEFGYLRLSDAYVQISSIMPQKRNPVPLEHSRVLASRALFEAQSVVGSLHNTPFADMNDAEDDLQPLVYTAFEDAERSVRLLAGVLQSAQLNTAKMATAAEGNFLPVTELADTLVRSTGMSFHSAHSIVSKAVRELNGNYDADAMTDLVARELEGKYAVQRDQIRAALSAKNFVAVRKIVGGPAPEALEPEIARSREAVASDQAWTEQRSNRLAEAHQAILKECKTLLERV
ncbi:argininosuccinate lyase [Edaphobacter albus]|uniref:argininosuccinate lyase n=1 Tax=Edaphobacter sp. 4G125 TaxID=2763071 RepID=UPI0016492024|nr:argininosuccinate lyase [Edaphobacter sp. 4G125]QNI37374.1 argininosuccinate lyase [Edaphobacter sp. 4G125]